MMESYVQKDEPYVDISNLFNQIVTRGWLPPAATGYKLWYALWTRSRLLLQNDCIILIPFLTFRPLLRSYFSCKWVTNESSRSSSPKSRLLTQYWRIHDIDNRTIDTVRGKVSSTSVQRPRPMRTQVIPTSQRHVSFISSAICRRFSVNLLSRTSQTRRILMTAA